jgi:hypothetical protein
MGEADEGIPIRRSKLSEQDRTPKLHTHQAMMPDTSGGNGTYAWFA